MSSDWEYADIPCPKCGHDTASRRCDAIDCEDGGYHDCGEDCCACLYPEPNTPCEECHGRGRFSWCRHCGWDLLEKRYLNGKSELAPADLEWTGAAEEQA